MSWARETQRKPYMYPGEFVTLWCWKCGPHELTQRERALIANTGVNADEVRAEVAA